MSKNIYENEIQKIDKDEPTLTYKAIWNEKLLKWEYVPLHDYLNSFSNLIDNNKNIFELKDELSTKYSTEISNEITKLQNIENITDGEDDEKKQARKFYNYMKEFQAESKEKKQGDN